MQIESLGKLRYNVRGDWDSSTSYYIDDIVLRLSNTYRCISDNSNADPLTNAANWEQIGSLTLDKGEWNSGTTYYTNNIVTVTSTYQYDRHYNWQDVDSYIFTGITTVGISPTTDSNWHKICSGTMNQKYAFLGGVNEGYVPTYKKIWDAKCGACPGGVGIVTISNGGSGFTTTNGYPSGLSTATVSFSGNRGSGSGATGVAYVSAAGTIFGIEITDPGSGYTNPISVTLSGGGGSGFIATAFSYQSKVGMGDTVGQAANSSYAGDNTETNSSFSYISRRYGLMHYGGNTNDSFGTSSEDVDQFIPVEASFVHLDWYEGLLPTPDGLPPKVIQVEHATHGNLVLFNNGEVHYAGYNGQGQAGDNTTTEAQSYVRCGYARYNKSGTTVLRGKKAIRIASSQKGGTANGSMYALIENGDGSRELYSWGYNNVGQLGDGSTTNRDEPTLISFDQATNGRIIELWASGGQYGYLHILTDSGKLFGCGYNVQRQLGDGTATNRSSLVEIYDFGAINETVKKYVHVGGENFGQTYVLTETSSNETRLYSWGDGSNGVLGHGHVFDVSIPLLVNTGGYSGVTAIVTNAAGAGTTVGVAFTNVYDVWGRGPNGDFSSAFISVGSTVGMTTALATGKNSLRDLSLGQDDNTDRNIFTGMEYNDGQQLTNVIDVQAWGHDTSHTYGATFVHRYQGDWYVCGYRANQMGIGHNDTYNARQSQDPNNLASNYRLKNNIYWQQPVDQSYIRVCHRSNSTGGGFAAFINLKTGRVNVTGGQNQHGLFGYHDTIAAGIYIQQSLSNH